MIIKINVKYEIKSYRKALQFASNQHITCFILRRHLMQIAM
ncbi:hypothetical protein HMPREF0971_01570 [Segatella oris F0302]|uniref:Uncharacterized protein n=1 Tax=Segatella oris F0302 TaxID=649760 RepID=D1QRG4_9BACT|nr:hypothetical protein HMPREF0971_01570 [Segatella oris F0302]